MKKLILGSNSPRRKEMLTQMGFAFDMRASHVDEVLPEGYDVKKSAEYLAVLKNNQVRRATAEEVILTADTVVLHQGKILGKPKNCKKAQGMLKKLSNTEHEVITGVCISAIDKRMTFSVSTMVKFKELNDQEINQYIDQYEPYDKAGAYGIQEWIGLIGISWIHGSYRNVMGLPTEMVYQTLTSHFYIHPEEISTLID